MLNAGIFFVLPCIETYQKVDLRTITLGVPPQEVDDDDDGDGGFDGYEYDGFADYDDFDDDDDEADDVDSGRDEDDGCECVPIGNHIWHAHSRG